MPKSPNIMWLKILWWLDWEAEQKTKNCTGHADLKTHETGYEYLEFNECETKTPAGEKQGTHQRAFWPKQYTCPWAPENCPVVVYNFFHINHPESMNLPELSQMSTWIRFQNLVQITAFRWTQAVHNHERSVIQS